MIASHWSPSNERRDGSINRCRVACQDALPIDELRMLRGKKDRSARGLRSATVSGSADDTRHNSCGRAATFTGCRCKNLPLPAYAHVWPAFSVNSYSIAVSPPCDLTLQTKRCVLFYSAPQCSPYLNTLEMSKTLYKSTDTLHTADWMHCH